MRYVAKSHHAEATSLPGFLSVHRANNHPLNTLLVGLTTVFFTYRELAIRLPNLVAFGAYLWIAIGASRRFHGRPLVFGLLALNCSLAELFGLARGYGLSAALTLAALTVQPTRAKDEAGIRMSVWLLLFASLAN
jgi:hypothetical protein